MPQTCYDNWHCRKQFAENNVRFKIRISIPGPKEYKRVCYYTNWSQYRPGRGKFLPENVDPSLCTHIIYAFATMSANRLAAYEWNDEDTAWSSGMYETSLLPSPS